MEIVTAGQVLVLVPPP